MVSGCTRPITYAFVMLILLAGCMMSEKERNREQTLSRYQAALRFGEYQGLINFIDPEYLKENPITSLEVNRLYQFKVSGYKVRAIIADDDEQAFTQTVELRLFHQRTLKERTMVYRERWVWHKSPGVWRLHSGLPDVSQAY